MARGKNQQGKDNEGPTEVTEVTTQEQQADLDLGTTNPDTVTSGEAQGKVEREAADLPDTSGALKSPDAPEVGPSPDTPAITSATEGPTEGVDVSGTNDTSDTTDVGDGTFGKPGDDGTGRNPNVTSDQVSGIDQMPGNTPEDVKARDSYVSWFAGGPRCETAYCNKPQDHADGDVDPVHGWVNTTA